MIYITNYNLSFSNITIASDGKYIVGLWMENQKYFCKNIKEEMIENDDIKVFEQTKKWLE